jgi:hypothetical protein
MTADASVAVGYVHPGFVPHPFVISLFDVMASPNFHSVGWKRSGPMIATARNELVQWFLTKTDATHLWFVDTDVTFTKDTLAALLESDLPIVSALYFTPSEDDRGNVSGIHPSSALMRNDNGGLRYLTTEELEAPTILKTEGVATGCVLIQRQVLETLGHGELHPYAETLTDDGALGEDMTFCRRAKELGFESYLNTGVWAGHVKPVVFGAAAMRT